mmetsp:Transcript_12564/g.12363  ORF Transcript_12564/g.12363 Transcript_12564/m.12363 type:complete len:105 (+) Transcript_12564:726-1040(+)
MKSIKDVDKDNKGSVINKDLEAILKKWYPEQLKDKDLNKLLSSLFPHNKIFIDYKKFKELITRELHKQSIMKNSQDQNSGMGVIQNPYESKFTIDLKPLNYFQK